VLRFLLSSPAELREWMTRVAEQFPGDFWSIVQTGGFCLGQNKARAPTSSAAEINQ